MTFKKAIFCFFTLASSVCAQADESVSVKIKYSSTGGTPNATTTTSVKVSEKPPTESEVSAAIKKAHPQWNFIILEIK